MTTPAFINPADLAIRFADISDFAEATVAAACTDANGTVAGYALPRYSYLASLAHEDMPASLRFIAVALARRNLYAFDAPEGVVQAAADAMKQLRDIASGVMQLPANLDPLTEGDTLIYSGSEVQRLGSAAFGG